MDKKNVLAILGSPHKNGMSTAMKPIGKELPKQIMKKIERCLK